ALVGVIDHHHELIGPQAVRAFQGEVAHVAGHVLLLWPRPAIVEAFDALGYAQAPGPHRTAGRHAVPAGARIRAIMRPGGGRARGGLDFLAAAGAAVHQATFRQAVEALLIAPQALLLPDGFAVPAHAQGLQLLHDEPVGPRHHARRIDVFDAQQPA